MHKQPWWDPPAQGFGFCLLQPQQAGLMSSPPQRQEAEQESASGCGGAAVDVLTWNHIPI